MVQAITQKNHGCIKLLVDDADYSKLERDSHGYVLRLAGPIRHSESLLKIQGMFFDNDPKGRLSLWRLYKASVSHLSVHSILTDYGIYRDIADGADMNELMFSISMVEDFAVRGYMYAKWPGLVLDTAYANHVSALRLRDLTQDTNLGNKIAANLLSYSLVGRGCIRLGTELEKEIELVHTQLLNLESDVRSTFSNFLGSSEEPKEKSSLVNSGQKVLAVAKLMRLFEINHARLPNVYTPPYTDTYEENDLFGTVAVENIGGEAMTWALNTLSLEITTEKMAQTEKAVSIEAETILGEWEYALKKRERLVSTLKELDPKSHFEQICFPKEDYSEFVRTRSKLIGPIKRVVDQLRMVKSTTDESQGKLSGYVDMPVALQVIASKSKRNDVFTQDEIEKKSEAWAIIGDLSKSLEAIQGEMKDVLVALAEVSKELFPSHDSWACYAFNENLHVIKDFSEPYNSSVKGRIGSLPSGIKTYLPDAIRLTAKRLTETTADIKVMLVASDGYPLGYYGIENDLKEAIEQVSKTGILLVGLGIGSENTKRYFKSNCTITQPYDLMKYFAKTYMEISSMF